METYNPQAVERRADAVVSTPKHEQTDLGSAPRTRGGSGRLLRKLLIYHLLLAAAVVVATIAFPRIVAQLPIGGITTLALDGDITVAQPQGAPAEAGPADLDRLGYARQLALVLGGVWLLMLPVSWVHKGIHERGMHDHSLDETTLILPGVVAAIVLVVQHSLALAFSLAGIIAGVQFRRALQDTFDALFILVAIGVGIAAGVRALEIAAVLTVFFSYATLYVYSWGDGLESDHLARRKAAKRLRKEQEATAGTTDEE
jgi:hypothetical protein